MINVQASFNALISICNSNSSSFISALEMAVNKAKLHRRLFFIIQIVDDLHHPILLLMHFLIVYTV